MGCTCCNKNETKVLPFETPSSSDPELDFHGPLKHRECRDVIFLIIFLAFLIGSGGVMFVAVKQGNPYRLIYGVDSWGNVCNQKNEAIPNVSLSGQDHSNKSKVFFFDPAYFLSLMPNNVLPTIDEDHTQIICVEKCPDREAGVAEFYNEDGLNLCQYGTDPNKDDPELCPASPVGPHISKFNRCIPKSLYDQFKGMIKSFASILANVHMGGEITENIISDLSNTWKEIGYLGCIAVGVAFLVVILMRVLAAVIVWTLVILTAALCLGATAYSWYAWYALKEEYDAMEPDMQTKSASDSVTTWLVYSGIATVITVVVLLILLVLRKRIALVVQLYVEAGRAIGKMPLLLLLPIWTLILLIVAVAALCLIAVFIETSGLPVVNPVNGHVKFEIEKFWVYLRWYNLFAILWVSAFFMACQDLAIAGAVAKWYFTRDKKQLGSPILQSIKNLIRYHLGSVAFGSLIIALVRLARLILAYIQKKLKGKVGKVADFILKCLQCCMWCFDKFLCYLNRNAYIEIAIYGYSFCSSAKKAFLLIVANALRVAAINSIGDFVLFLGKLSTAAIVMVIGNVAFFSNREDIVYRWVPITVSCMFAFAISHCFLLVYEITIDTIFVCFCEDCERNDGVSKPYFMSKNLMKYLDDSAKENLKKEQLKSNKKNQKSTKV